MARKKKQKQKPKQVDELAELQQTVAAQNNSYSKTFTDKEINSLECRCGGCIWLSTYGYKCGDCGRTD